MHIRVRGQHRLTPDAKPNDLTITRQNGYWFASVTLRVKNAICAHERTSDEHRGLNLGVSAWATFDDGEVIGNPRWVREELPKFANFQREKARKKRGSLRHRRLADRVAIHHERIANLRRYFLHKIRRHLYCAAPCWTPRCWRCRT